MGEVLMRNMVGNSVIRNLRKLANRLNGVVIKICFITNKCRRFVQYPSRDICLSYKLCLVTMPRDCVL